MATVIPNVEGRFSRRPGSVNNFAIYGALLIIDATHVYFRPNEDEPVPPHLLDQSIYILHDFPDHLRWIRMAEVLTHERLEEMLDAFVQLLQTP